MEDRNFAVPDAQGDDTAAEAIPDSEQTADKDVQAVVPAGKEHLDFATAIILIIVCSVLSVYAWGYYTSSGKEFYASPGFMPMVILGILFLLSVSLLFQSIHGSSIRKRAEQLVTAAPRGLKSKRFWNSAAALLIFGVYIHVLLRFLPFWLASLLLLFFTFVYLNAASLIKCVIISVLSVGGTVLIFQTFFHVPLP